MTDRNVVSLKKACGTACLQAMAENCRLEHGLRASGATGNRRRSTLQAESGSAFRPAAALLVAVAGLALSTARPAIAQPSGEVLSDLQSVTRAAVEAAAPSVVRIIVPELTEQEREVIRQRERRRRAEAMAMLDALADGAEGSAAADESDGTAETRPGPVDDLEPLPELPLEMDDEEWASREKVTRTGMVISRDGYVITSLLNVGEQFAGLRVELADGRVLPARRLGVDTHRDVVLLKVEADNLPEPRIAPAESMRIGQWVLAIGRTLPVGGPTVSKGILSARERAAGIAVQTDANVSPANYGGPLVDVEGRVVAMIAGVDQRGSSAGVEMFADSGIGFAIPIHDILEELDELKAGQQLRAPFLGVQFSTWRMGRGAEIMRVFHGTAADEAGMRDGDVILEVEGQEIVNSFLLLHQIGSRRVGDTLRIRVKRGEETIELQATLKPRPEHL